MNHGLWLPAWLQCKPNRMSRGANTQIFLVLVPGDFTINYAAINVMPEGRGTTG